MAISIASILSVWLGVLWSSHVNAVTRVYDFELGWVRANPDGLFERPTIGINGQWPIPRIEATVGDRLVVNVNNQLGNQTASLHFHGIFQNGTTEMDGSAGVSHCPIPAGSRFTYNFTVSVDLISSTAFMLNEDRSNNRGRTGTTAITKGNIPMVSEVL